MSFSIYRYIRFFKAFVEVTDMQIILRLLFSRFPVTESLDNQPFRRISTILLVPAIVTRCPSVSLHMHEVISDTPLNV